MPSLVTASAKKYAFGSLSNFETLLIWVGAGFFLIVVGFLLTRHGDGSIQSRGRKLKGAGIFIIIVPGILWYVLSILHWTLY
jgi:hypothetical protein